jgi:hypothetical protein
MIREVVEGRINRPPSEIFDLLADVRNELRWHRDVRSVEKETPGEIGAGTVFRARYRGLGETRVEHTEFDRPRLLGVAADARPMSIRLRFTFSEADGGTAIRCEAEAAFKGARRALEPLFAPLFRKELRKRPSQLERALALG